MEKTENLKRNNIVRFSTRVNTSDLAWIAVLKFGFYDEIVFEVSEHNRHKANLIIEALLNLGIELVNDERKIIRIYTKYPKERYVDETVYKITLRTILPMAKRKSKQDV